MFTHRLMTLALVLCAAVATPTALGAQSAQGFYRYPALYGDTVVFAAEGDLWKVAVAGGEARRLTTHPGEETNPVISPDGRTLAFTARYEGPAEVYTMPLSGGVPTRRTYEAEPSLATTWTPDGKLVYTTVHYSGLPKPRLVTIDLATNTHAQVPLFEATEGAYADGGTLYFVRPAFHNNVTKRYTGGTARDVWVFDGRTEARELTGDWQGESHSPMWWSGRVYFVSDRDGTMNLWSMDGQGGDLRQHTRHSGWDVRGTSLHRGRIAYQLGADLRLFDIASGQDRVVPITLPSDFDQLREKWVENPMEYLTSAHLHPNGDAVVLTARGRVFVAPAAQGRLVRAVRKDSVRFRDVVFMPDGKALLGLSDETGELEFVTIPANGVGPDRRITNDGTILRFTGTPSPDGKWVAYNDNNQDLWILEVATGRQRTVSQRREFAGDVAWSPDSRWLAYVEVAPNAFAQLWLYDLERGTRTAVTTDRVNSGSPAWDPKGEFLYFLSDRNLESLVGSPWGSRQPEPFFDRDMEVYAVALRPGVRLPFRPDDELTTKPAAAAETAAGQPLTIETGGLARRLERVPVPAGNYSGLTMNGDALFMVSRESGPDADAHLVAVKITDRNPKAEPVVEDIRSYEMSLDGKKLLVRKGSDLYVIDAKASKTNLADARVDLRGWTFSIDVRDDWRQIFVDAWRLERDYFYDPNMHGVDWDAQLAKYLPLVERITTRDELSDLIGWFVGELSALHTSVRGGDLRTGEDNVRVPSLGARLTRDPAAGGYRVAYIYQSDPDYPDEMSPLADPALDVRAGDVITAVNGVGVLTATDIGALLRNQEGRQVLVTVRRGDAARDVIVVPTASEFDLRYSDWEYTRRLAVEQKSDGTIGYVHLRAMGGDDITTWYRDFYPVFNRPGLIVDVRHNNGGNIDAFILEKLLRKAWMYWQGRVGGPTWNMHYAFRGHVVVLVDQRTASDGEAFAEGFRRLGLGVVIGMRTWGGEIWLSSSNRLTDGGLARAPMTGVYGPEGEWLIEQIGVIPDIEVDNLPHATFNGSDAQLDTAIDYLMRKIAEDPRAVPPPPAYPNRRFDYPGDDGR